MKIGDFDYKISNLKELKDFINILEKMDIKDDTEIFSLNIFEGKLNYTNLNIEIRKQDVEKGNVRTTLIFSEEVQINNMRNFTTKLIFQVGDLIQNQNYRNTTPINADIYNLIGSLLKELGKYNKEEYKVKTILNECSNNLETLYKSKKNIWEKILEFDATMLVDLVSRMQQGENKDDVFDEALNFVKEQYNFNNK